MAAAKSQDVVNKANEILKTVPAKKVMTPILDGKTLSGWEGSTACGAWQTEL